jgi:hypothetical protein
VHGDVDPGLEQLGGAAGDPLGQVGGVVGGGLDQGIAEAPGVGVQSPAGL